jgi:ribosomal protein L37AE/L43A
MPKQQNRQNKCPECGEIASEPYKTWELVAPMPDKHMRITVTVFGMYECKQCGKKFKGIVAKAKMGAEGIEI